MHSSLPGGLFRQELAKPWIVGWSRIEGRSESPERRRVELKEAAVQKDRRGFASGGVEHELGTILSDRLCGTIDQGPTRFVSAQVDNGASSRCASHSLLLISERTRLYTQCQYNPGAAA